ncbi:cobalamin biosynthesis protein CobG [Sphingomonas sp. 37zxx]|uniref:cobalamin biosynthesis protein CobG n=1 Tax=Sphingomonas sp. 37zxx TaxID=1550073 RepID=UPI00053BE7A5|nr:cobalamin biosynthesis protein CobG [Sphingomonas sp. 37zxx]
MSIVRGWCPTAYRPMAAGDGLLVRVRPRLGRLTRAQALGLCEAAAAHGNGQIDLTNRASLQIRGVRDGDWPALIASLCALDLVDADPAIEARRALLCAPGWQDSDDTHRIAIELTKRLADLPALPGKFGFAIDAGEARVLYNDPADIRIERGEAGGVILRADGRATGVAVSTADAVNKAIALAHWFVASGGVTAGRMTRHPVSLPRWADQGDHPAPASPTDLAGAQLGPVHGMPFGRIDADALAQLVQPTSAVAIRVTPWRRLIVEGGALPDTTEPAAIRADACVGAPACPQASVSTRAIARRLAPYVDGHLHVSGCAKGCARALPAAVVLTGRDGRFDLAFDAKAGAPPALAGLDEAQILTHFGAA